MSLVEDFALSAFTRSVIFAGEAFNFLATASELPGTILLLGGTGVTLLESSVELIVRSRFLLTGPSAVTLIQDQHERKTRRR